MNKYQNQTQVLNFPFACLAPNQSKRLQFQNLRLIQDAGHNTGAESLQAVRDFLNIAELNIRNISHQVRNIALVIGDLLINVVVSQNLVDTLQHTRNVVMNVDDSGVVWLVHGERTKINLWQVNCTKRNTKVNVSDQRIRNLNTNSSLCLLGGASNMGGEDEVLQATEILSEGVQVVVEVVAISSWLIWINIQRGTSNLSAAHSVYERWDVDNASASVVEEIASLLHLRKLPLINEILGLWKLWDVEGDKIGGVQKCLEGWNLLCRSQTHQGKDIVVDDGHPHGLRQDGQLGTNVSVSDDTECLSADLPALGGDLVPGTVVKLIRAVTELASESDDLANNELSDGAGVGKWRVENSDTVAGCVLEVDLVGADAEAADDDEVLCSLEHLCVQLGLGADTDDMNIPSRIVSYDRGLQLTSNYSLDFLNELVLWQRGLQGLDLVALALQNINTGLVDILQQQDLDVLRVEWLQLLRAAG